MENLKAWIVFPASGFLELPNAQRSGGDSALVEAVITSATKEAAVPKSV